jgi:hypothetical protein
MLMKRRKVWWVIKGRKIMDAADKLAAEKKKKWNVKIS